MVDYETVCCMCGDVGFPEKLFRCSKCRSRFQHSYCSNYYSENAEPIQVCEWCQCEGRNSNSSRHSNASSSKNNGKSVHANEVRSTYSGEKIKQHHHRDENTEKATPKAPSPRTTTPRRYKLLKDVMC